MLEEIRPRAYIYINATVTAWPRTRIIWNARAIKDVSLLATYIPRYGASDCINDRLINTGVRYGSKNRRKLSRESIYMRAYAGGKKDMYRARSFGGKDSLTTSNREETLVTIVSVRSSRHENART